MKGLDGTLLLELHSSQGTTLDLSYRGEAGDFSDAGMKLKASWAF